MSAGLGARARATAAGLTTSRMLPELPDRLHPVARFGSLMTEVERHLWRDDRWAGVIHAVVGAGLGAVAGRVAGTSATVSVAASGAQLRRTASAIGDQLRRGDLAGARAALPSLVGRDPSALDESGVVSAVIESVAENMVDAVFAPAWWALVAGGPGVGAHRAVNTMDAMIGRRDDRFRRYGWAAARADDAMAYVPARLFVLALVAVRPDRSGAIVGAVRRDAPEHPSPNAGVAEAAMAGALGCRLGGTLRYGDRTEDRPMLGDGPRPGPTHLEDAIDLADRTEQLLIAALGGLGAVLGVGRRWRR